MDVENLGVVVFVVVMMMMLRQHETETKSGAGQRELARKGVKWLGINVRLYWLQFTSKRLCLTGRSCTTRTLSCL